MRVEFARRSNSQVWHRISEVKNGSVRTMCRAGIIEEELVLSANYGDKLCPTCFPGSAKPPVRTTAPASRRRV